MQQQAIDKLTGASIYRFEKKNFLTFWRLCLTKFNYFWIRAYAHLLNFI